MFVNPRIPPANYHQKINEENQYTGLPTENETMKKILKLYFLFLHPIKYFDGLPNGLQRILNARKRTKINSVQSSLKSNAL